MPKSNVDEVIIYTDGACSGNPGKGGWGAILMYGTNKKEISGAEENTTNNKMELTAPIEALKLLKRPCSVKIYSDSAYLVNAFLQGWIYNWYKNGFKTADKKDVKNRELWETIYKYTKIHKIEYNNRCDELAVSAIKNLK